MKLEARVHFGARILVFGSRLGSDWESNYAQARQSNDLALKLCLIHPDWFDPDNKVGEDPRGPRAFRVNFPNGQQCQSSVIWGYLCNFSDSDLVADHLYPYSAGGSTDSRNLVWLCRWHNSVKSSDIHLIDWDSVDSGWVDDLLGRIEIRRELLEISRSHS
jgi:hypothetical protein